VTEAKAYRKGEPAARIWSAPTGRRFVQATCRRQSTKAVLKFFEPLDAALPADESARQ
jgi:hypothetical protein